MKSLIELVLRTGNNLMHTNYTLYDVESEWRESNLVSIRHAYFYLMVNHSGQSLSQIGASIIKDHATVIHGKKKVAMALENLNTGNKNAALIVLKCKKMFKAMVLTGKEDLKNNLLLDRLEANQFLEHFKKRERAKAHLAVELCKRYVEDFELMLKDDTSMEGWRREVMKRKLESVKYQLK
jgi:hypothetical protein